MSGPPRIGSTVMVEGDDTGFIGKVIAVVRTPSVIVETPNGRTFVVPREGHTFTSDEDGT